MTRSELMPAALRDGALAAGFLILLNAALMAVWTPLAWGLRGSAYEPGRPTAEDETSMMIGAVLLGVALLSNLGTPLVAALTRRWGAALGSLLAWVCVPLSYVLSLVLLAVGVRLFFA